MSVDRGIELTQTVVRRGACALPATVSSWPIVSSWALLVCTVAGCTPAPLPSSSPSTTASSSSPAAENTAVGGPGAVDRGAFGDGERQVSEHTDAQGRKWLGDVPYDVFFDDPLGVAAEGRSENRSKTAPAEAPKPKSEVAAVERSHASSTAAPATSATDSGPSAAAKPARTGRQTGRRLRRLG